MEVNPAYQGIALPVAQWPLLDTHIATSFGATTRASRPLIGAVAAVGGLADRGSGADRAEHAVRDRQLAGRLRQPGSGDPEARLSRPGESGQPIPARPGVARRRATLRPADRGVADAEHGRPDGGHHRRDRADLCGADHVDARARGEACCSPDDAAGTWPIPYDAMRTTAAGADAYPGILLISTDVPTQGLPSGDAKDYSELLDFAAGTGQTPGLGNGQLPDGYLPMTAANGLGSLVAYTRGGRRRCRRPAVRRAQPQRCGRAGAVVQSADRREHPDAAARLRRYRPQSGVDRRDPDHAGTGSSTTPSATPTPKPSPSTRSTASSPVLARAGKTEPISAGVVGLALPLVALLALGRAGRLGDHPAGQPAHDRRPHPSPGHDRTAGTPPSRRPVRGGSSADSGPAGRPVRVCGWPHRGRRWLRRSTSH